MQDWVWAGHPAIPLPRFAFQSPGQPSVLTLCPSKSTHPVSHLPQVHVLSGWQITLFWGATAKSPGWLPLAAPKQYSNEHSGFGSYWFLQSDNLLSVVGMKANHCILEVRKLRYREGKPFAKIWQQIVKPGPMLHPDVSADVPDFFFPWYHAVGSLWQRGRGI